MKSICISVLAGGALGLACTQPVLATETGKTKEKVVYFFDSSDGSSPMATLTYVNGQLYGTTEVGGRYNFGTVFSFDPKAGTFKLLYSFCSQSNCTDGTYPNAGVIVVNGMLYGTTLSGGGQGTCGDYGCGTVFSLDPDTGAETVLHAFGNGADGQGPSVILVDMKGKLYGTTRSGGTSGAGTAFLLDPKSGAETVLHSFCSQQNCSDGAYPFAGLTIENDTLYGTTYNGGNFNVGILFALNPKSGAETALHTFGGSLDGWNPGAGLIDTNGILYGTTAGGGANQLGTVFAFDPDTGTETVLYSFDGASDGQNPDAGLIEMKGALYGTTPEGGANGSGTVFVLDPNAGKETILYSFCRKQNCADGNDPVAGLVEVNSTLYGTTYFGGAYGEYGTVFALRHP